MPPPGRGLSPDPAASSAAPTDDGASKGKSGGTSGTGGGGGGGGGTNPFEETLKNTRNTLHCLEQLKCQHEQMLNGLQQSKLLSSPGEEEKNMEERLKAVSKSKERIEVGVSDAQFMIQVYAYIKQLEGEKRLLQAQVKRLCQENAWLREELNTAHKTAQANDQKMAALEVEKQHLEFLNSLKKYDDNEAGTGGTAMSQLPSWPKLDTSNSEINLSELGLTDENEDSRDSGYSGPDGSHPGSGEEIPGKLRTLHNLVIQYASQGRYEVAIPLCKQALEDLESNLGHQHPDVATMLNILALVYRDQNKFREASNLLQDALQIRENTLGQDHPSVAATLNNLAVLYGRRGRYRDAEPLCKRALAIREKALGANHPDVAKQLNNLALLCQNQSKYDEVEQYYSRALAIYEEQLGSDDSNVAKTKNNLASAYLKQGKLQAAEDLFKEVLRNGLSLNGAAAAGEVSGGGGGKDSMPYEDYGSWHKTAAVDSPTVSTTLKNLASLYKRQSKTEAADALEDLAVQARKNALNSERKNQLREILNSSGTIVPRPSQQPVVTRHAQPRRDSSSSTASNAVVYAENSVDLSGGGHEWNSEMIKFAKWECMGYFLTGDGSMHRAGSLSKLRASLQSSGKRLAKAFGRSPLNSGAPPPSSGMKRASSLTVLPTSNSNAETYQLGTWNREI